MTTIKEVNKIFVDLSRYKGLSTITPSGYPDLYAISADLTEHPDKPIEGVIVYTGEEPLPLRGQTNHPLEDKSV